MNVCIYCSSEEYELKYSLEDIYGEVYKLCKCKSCSVYYLNPQPSPAQLKKAYGEDYYGGQEKKFNTIVESIVDWFRRKNAAEFASRLKGGARVLDVGCGNGNFLHYLGKHGDFDLHGIEPEGKSAERALAHSEIKLTKGYLQKELFPDNYFDAITFTHVFEHLNNPREILYLIQQISKNGAILQIEIPNIDSWQSALFKQDWFHLDPPRHLNMFPPSVLKRELRNQNWELVSEKFISPQFNVYGVQQSFLNRISSKRDVLYEHLKGNASYSKEYNQFLLHLHQLFHWLTFPLFVLTDIIASSFKRGGTVKLTFKKQ